MIRPGCLVLLVLGVCLQSQAQGVTVVETDAALKHPMQTKARLGFTAAGPSSLPSIQVNDAVRYQTIDGFGASFTDSSAWLVFTQLPSAQRHKVMRRLFDARNGIGLGFLRQPMGASDFARNHYSYDDMPEGRQDPDLEHFSIQHDEAYILPVLREALKINPDIRIMATPWSAPGWMKSSQSMIGGSLSSSSHAAYANYFVRFLRAYEQAGVPVYAISMQNEPLYLPKDYPGMSFPAEEQARFLGTYLGPALDKAGLHPKVLVYDHNWDKPEYPISVLSDDAASRYAAGTAWHCYGGDPAAQSAVHEKFPAKDTWETECSGGTWQKGNLLATTARLIIASTRNWAKSVVLWNIALDEKNGPHTGGCDTCRGLVTVDRTKTPATVTYTVDYYALGQVGKFVRPGAARIESNNLAGGVEDVAFRNPDGSIVLFALNGTETPAEFRVNYSNKSFTYSLPAGSVATFQWSSGASGKKSQ